MIKKVILLVVSAVITMGTAMGQDLSRSLRSEQATLEDLAAYIDTTRGVDPGVKLFYANLVNNPTHSYRIEHFDVGFNGCTGRVDEKVVMADGSQRNNVFIFNDQGLLTQSTIQGAKGQKTVTDYTYSYDEVLGYTLKQSKSKNRTIKYAPIFGEHGRRESIKGDVVREETGGKVLRYHYDFDTATGKKFLIAIKELKGNDVVHERTFDYDIDTHGRYTRVDVSLDGKHQMTITRSY